MKNLATKIGMYLLAAGIINISSQLQAQNVGINSTGSAPNNSAGLDVDFTNKGLLIPRVALTSATDGATIPSPATSLLVFHTGGGGLSSGYYYNAGTPGSPNWVKLFNGGSPADAWLTSGNAGTTAGTHFLGTTDNVDLVFKTNNNERARITSAGRVGINTSAPGSYYLDVLSNNSSIDGIRGLHTSGSTASAFAAVTGSVSNSLYTTATGYLGYHNSNNVTFAVYGNGGDLAGMFNGKVGINSVSTNLTNYDLEIRNNSAANPVNTLLRATAQKPNTNDILTNLDFGDSYVSTAQAKIQVIRDAAASSASDLPTAIGFWTTNDGTSTPIEKMRITNNGNVGIGTTSPGTKLDIVGAGNTSIDLRVNGRIQTGDANGNGGIWLSNVGDGFIGNNGGNIGFWTNGVGFNAFQISKTNGFVGIGTTNPFTRLHIENGSILISNSFDNVLLSTQTPQNKAFHLIGSYMGWDQNAIYIGGYNGIAPTGSVAGIPISSDKVVCGGNGAPFFGIPIYASAFNTTSSKLVKQNIETLNYGLSEIIKMQPVKYEYTYDKNHIPHIGLIAEDVLSIVPEVVSVLDEQGNHLTPYNKNGKAVAIDYSKLTVVLINAIKEQQQIINHLKDENEYLKQELQKQNQKFSAELEKIKQHIGIGEAKK